MPSMRIGINCTGCDPKYSGGVNTYTLGLLQGLANVAGDYSLQLYVTKANQHIFESFRTIPHMETVVVADSGLRRTLAKGSVLTGSESLHRTIADKALGPWTRVMDEGSDIIYVPTTVLFPYTYRRPTLLSMHDIQQIHYPQFFNRADLFSRRIKYGLSARLATFFQASSQFIKEDLLAAFPFLNAEQIVTIPEGVDIDKFSSKVAVNVTTKYGIPKDFLFFPAQLWPHKNHITVLKALERLRSLHGLTIPLVLTGAKPAGAEQILSYISENGLSSVHYLGVVPFEDLVALYQSARFFITAVLYESSSLPLREAAAAGCPVIASSTPPNREAAQILKIELFTPTDYIELADLLRRVWEDDLLARDHASCNRKAVEYFSWDNTARRYLEFIEKVCI